MWQSHAGSNRKAFRAIARLRELRAFEKTHFRGAATPEARDLLYEIGYRQAARRPLTVKQALLLEVGSVATVQRRLRELRHLGIVQQKRSAADARVQELTLSDKSLAIFAACDDLMRAEEARLEEAA